MDVTLTPQLEDLVRQKVETGRYVDASDVIGEALRLLDSHERLARFRESLVEADRELDRGEGEEWSPELMERLKREGDEMFRQGIRPDADVCPYGAGRAFGAGAS